jgi:hypothetical protein
MKMRLLKQTMAVLGTVATIAILAAVISPKSARAVVATLVQIVPGSTTHVGQNESQMVGLYCVGATCYPLNGSGTALASSYVVPAGYTFMITDYEWLAYGSAPSGQLVCDYIFMSLNNVDYAALPAGSCTIASSDNRAYRADHFTAGVRVASGMTIFDGNASNGYGYSAIQGYLVPN